MWFCLCASLVHKYNDLIGVFFSFISCFALAHGLKTFLFAGSSKEKEDTSTTTKESSSTTTKEDTNRRVQEGRRIKHIVGLVACSLSFWYLLQSDDTNNTNTNNSNNNNAEFMALTICTGYLAFDLWYSAMNDCYPIPPPIWTIVQDAVTLTAFLVSLCCYLDLASSYHQTISLWVSYKTICFVYQLATSSTTTTTATLAKTLDSTSATTSDIKSQASTSSSNTWTVHGADYDLTSFLNQHPGGKEAVEMGRGRDCTALFESYHPFTNKHRYVRTCVCVFSNTSLFCMHVNVAEVSQCTIKVFLGIFHHA
jgi:cytochrome b involved in lipid metabolism